MTMLMQMAINFPINALRNAAILLTATPLVAMIDVDMLISPELSEMARDADRRVRYGSAVLSPSPSARESSSCTAVCSSWAVSSQRALRKGLTHSVENLCFEARFDRLPSSQTCGVPAWRSPESRELVALAASPAMVVVPAFDTEDAEVANTLGTGAEAHARVLNTYV